MSWKRTRFPTWNVLNSSDDRSQLESLCTARNELYVASKTASEDLGIQSVMTDMDVVYGMNLLDVTATMCQVNHGD